MRAWYRVLTCVAVVALGSVACTSSTETANNTPASSSTQSQSASPSPSPSASPTESAPSPSPSPSSSDLAVASVPVHAGEVGVGYAAVTLGASGGTSPYTWATTGGSFPGGLALSSDGVISGQNSAGGHFNFTVTVTDSTGATASKQATIDVFGALVVNQPCAGRCNVGAGCTKCQAFGSVGGGLAPYTYAVVGGSPPAGMGVKGLSLTGNFPTFESSWSLQVQVTDAFGGKKTVNANWLVYAAADLIQGGDCIDANGSGSCTATGWSYSGSSPSTSPNVVIVGTACPPASNFCPGPPPSPPGWRATAQNGAITIAAANPPTSCGFYDAIVTIALVDTSSCPTSAQSNVVNIRVTMSPNPNAAC